MIRARHQGAQVRDMQSDALCAHVLNSTAYRDAKVIGGYMPLPHEADVTAVLLHALAHGKMLALPLCDAPPHMSFRLVTHLSNLIPGAYGIPEPMKETDVIAPEAFDMLLVPLEGIDPDGYRLGKGGGYYDAFLTQTNAYTIGCALSWQWEEQRIPREPWDHPLNACVDAQGIHVFKSKK